MKTTKQRKRKIVEPPESCNVNPRCTGVKKYANGSSGWHQKATGRYEYISTEEDPGVLPSAAAQVLGEQLPSRSQSFPEKTKELPALELKTGQFHPSTKIKLQLFPIDEGTLRGMEKDGHNPFLELTLKARKKISSVLKHINTKWGNSSVALGDPMLFPYNIQLENLATDRRWSLNNTDISAGDVYAAIGSPAIFCLRYGWFSNFEPKIFVVPSTSTPFACLESEGLQKGCSTISDLTYDRRKKLEGDEVKMVNGLAQSIVPWDDSLTNLSIGGLPSEASLLGNVDNCNSRLNWSKSSMLPIQLISDTSIEGLLTEASLQGKTNNCESTSNGSKLALQPTADRGLVQPPFPLEDSLTTLSIGGLLSEASFLGNINNCNPKSNASKARLQPTLLISDSFDAFISRQINSHPQAAMPLPHESHSSILDAEETCHAFPFRKFSSSGKDVAALSGRANSGGCNHDTSSNLFRFPNFSEQNKQTGLAQDACRQESKAEFLPHSRVYTEDSSIGLTGIQWNDSLGPFDLGLSTLRQVSSGENISNNGFVR